MSTRKAALALTTLCFLTAALWPASSLAAAPGWSLSVTPMPANFAPGKGGEYLAIATNVLKRVPPSIEATAFVFLLDCIGGIA